VTVPNNFADRLDAAMVAANSRIVVGLDPVWESLPEEVRGSALARAAGGHYSEHEVHCWAIREFCEGIISATSAQVCCFKPQVAFFERYGSRGIAVLEDLLRAHLDKLFICDGKRGDIGSTSSAYAAAYFGEGAPLGCAAVTFNAYLGLDTLYPYLPHLAAGHGMFILCKTSNPGSGDFQDQQIVSGSTDKHPLYLEVAQRIAALGQQFIGDCGFSSLGLVVGATYPEEAHAIRAAAPQALILVPGLGFQGGDPQAADAFCDASGRGAVFSFSRAILYAWQHGPHAESFAADSWREAAQDAATHYRQLLSGVLGSLDATEPNN
jgi:orotidine-5'-phosphate decarboxylase